MGVPPRAPRSPFDVTVGNVHSTDKTYLTVDDNNLPVIPVIHFTGELRETYLQKTLGIDTFESICS